jgi:dsRNA-specific ribonuclease
MAVAELRSRDHRLQPKTLSTGSGRTPGEAKKAAAEKALWYLQTRYSDQV